MAGTALVLLCFGSLLMCPLRASQFLYPVHFHYATTGVVLGNTSKPLTVKDSNRAMSNATIPGNKDGYYHINFTANVELQEFVVRWIPEDTTVAAEIARYRDFRDNSWHGIDSTLYDLRDRTGVHEWAMTGQSFQANGLELGLSTNNREPIYIQVIRLYGLYNVTLAPTTSPTEFPTKSPITSAPSKRPTTHPTLSPSVQPTVNPTPSPIWPLVWGKTQFSENSEFYLKHSENIFALSERTSKDCCTAAQEAKGKRKCPMTYSCYENYENPESGNPYPFCSTCILAWADIDANLQVDCQVNEALIIEDQYDTPEDFYFCEGTWKLVTTARLADWQRTYGRLEIWEVDDNDLKWLQVSYEFQWFGRKCNWTDESGETGDCDLLPLTGSIDRAAKFQWTAPKRAGDARNKPFIVVWSDLTVVPFSLRPPLNYSWFNLTFTEIKEGTSYDPQDLLTEPMFRGPFYGLCGLFGLFLLVVCAGCFKKNQRDTQYDFMVDTRNIKSVFVHSDKTLIVPEEKIRSRAKFSCKKHGPYLCVVLIGRLIYMVIFTFTFFLFVFLWLNSEWFDVLDQYDRLAEERDGQLWNLSSNIEDYYYNETDRMAAVVENRELECVTRWINASSDAYDAGAEAQYNNHSYQMEAPLNRVNLNLTGESVSFVEGATACETRTSKGADKIESAEFVTFLYDANHTVIGREVVRASDWSRRWDNWTLIEKTLDDRCLNNEQCVGWTWVDERWVGFPNATNATYYLFSSFGDPRVDVRTPGACYVVERYDTNSFAFTSVEELQNYTEALEKQYLDQYQEDVGGMYDSLSGIWQSLKGVDESGGDFEAAGFLLTYEYTVVTQNDPTADGYEMDIRLDDYRTDSAFNNTGFQIIMYYVLEISCPGCPAGNFTSPVLQEIIDYLNNYNYSNLSDYSNDTGITNFSDLISVDTELVALPDTPTIDLPLDVNGLGLDWSIFTYLFLALDFLLLIYRWYKLCGRLSVIIRGQDRTIQLAYLMVERDGIICCPRDKPFKDRMLQAVIASNEKMSNACFNFWKLFYWLQIVFWLGIVLICILMAYFVLDQVISLDFIENLGIIDLMTSGISAQRIVRNEVICTTAMTYNNYTLQQMLVTKQSYAYEKNLQAIAWNQLELTRVDEWNSAFCTSWGSYMATTRDVSSDGDSPSIEYPTNVGTGSKPRNAFDDSDFTFFVPFPERSEALLEEETNVTFTIELPRVLLRERDQKYSYWEVRSMVFNWNYNQSADDSNLATFDFQRKLDVSDPWSVGVAERNRYNPSSSQERDTDSIPVIWNETRFIRVVFPQAGKWGQAFQLNELRILGRVPLRNIYCPTTIFHYWSYDASDIATPLCPELTPIHGIMYRHWVRDWLNDQLWEAHKPIIKAIRNIVLSPFFIATTAIVILIGIQLLSWLVEFFLRRVDMYRENPVAMMPLVTTRWDQYDVGMHREENITSATYDAGYFNPEIADDEDYPDEDMGISNVMEGDAKVTDRAKTYYTDPTAPTTQADLATAHKLGSTSQVQMQPVQSHVQGGGTARAISIDEYENPDEDDGDAYAQYLRGHNAHQASAVGMPPPAPQNGTHYGSQGELGGGGYGGYPEDDYPDEEVYAQSGGLPQPGS